MRRIHVISSSLGMVISGLSEIERMDAKVSLQVY
jgi:hypothetical protein